MRGAVLLKRARVDVAFICNWSRAREASEFGRVVAPKPLCSNERRWWARGEFVAEDRVRVERGGHCPGCGCMGEASLQDTIHLLSPSGVVTVEVAG